jgi:hypothetical protein
MMPTITGHEPAVELLPMIATSIRRIDTKLLDGIDCLKHTLDLGPAGNAQKNLGARPHIRHGREGFAGQGSTQDVNPRDNLTCWGSSPSGQPQ